MSAPRALLVQPPVYDFALYDLFLHPYGLLRMGTWLEQSGYEVELLDSLDARRPGRPDGSGRGRIKRTVVETPAALRDVPRRYARYGPAPDTLRERVRASAADVVLLGTGMTYWYEGLAEIATMIRQEMPSAPVIAGGIAATLTPQTVAEAAGTDYVVRGDGASDASDASGAATGPALPELLTSLGLPPLRGPIPANPALSLQLHSGRLRDAAVIRLHEGCRGTCTYCASRLITPRFRAGREQDARERVREATAAGITTFAFYDDALLEGSQTLLEPFLEWVLSVYGERRLAFYLPNAVHVERLTPDIARLLYRAGCREVRLGVESLDEGFHARYDRKLRSATIAQTVTTLEEAGFRGREIAAYVLAGLPGQTADEVRSTVGGLGRLGCAPHVAEYSPVPGTPLFEAACEVSRYPLRSEPLCHNNSLFPTASASFTIDDLWKAKSEARAVRLKLSTR